MNSTDYDITEAMLKYGGSFVVALAQAARRADKINLAKIKTTWPECWAQYNDLANKDKE